MKKKIINGFLAVAILFGATSAFVSCKDYEEENLAPIIDRTAKLEKALNGQNSNLQSQIDALRQAQAACRNRCDSIVRVISAYDWDKYLTKEEAARTYVTLAAYNSTVERLDKAINLLQGRVDAIENTLNNTNGHNYQYWVEMIDANNRAIAEVRGIANEALQLAKDNAGRIDALTGRVDGLTERVDGLTGRVDGLEELLTRTVEKLDDLILAWSDKWQQAYEDAAYAKNLANENSALIGTLDAKVLNLQHIVDSLCGLPHGQQFDDSELKARVDSIVLALSGYATKEELAAGVAEAKAYADSLFALINVKADEALALAISDSIRINDLGGRVIDLENKYITLNTRIDSLACEVNDLKNKLEGLNRRVTRLENDLAKFVTGIQIENTSSAFGYLASPFGLNMQILAGFYGNSALGVEFPTKQAKFYTDAAQNFTEAEIAILGEDVFAQITKGADENFVAEVNGSEVGNAGTIYFTVNPHNVDATGLPVTLVNTKEEESAIKISAVQRADTVLTHGYYLTRAADNGFYAGKATLTVDQIDNAKLNANVDLESVKDAVNTALKDRSKSNLLNAASTIFNEVTNIEALPKYGLRTQWTDQSNNQVHKLFSNYYVAATAIRPLSFNTLKDAHFTVGLFDRAENLINGIIDRININFNLNLPDFSSYQISFQDVSIADFTNTSISFTLNYQLKDENGDVVYVLATTVDTGKYVWVGGDGRVYDANTMTLIGTNIPVQPVSITINDTYNVDLTPVLNDIITQLNNQFGANSDLAQNITGLLNDVASLGNLDATISGAFNDVKTNLKSTISTYIQGLNTRLQYALNHVNSVMQPVLLVSQNGKIGRASGMKSAPTLANGSMTLIPTSYNLELIAPAYKKFVAVANVFDAATGAQATNAAALAAEANSGANMKTVIDGDKTVTLKGQSGYTYEVIYSAVDYHGQVVNRRSYIKF